MSITAPPSGLQPEDFEKIEAAVMETARGRWFLLEYARRQRAAETDRLIAALAGLERRLAAPPAIDARLPAATAEHLAPPGADLPLAERLQDFAWSLRERGLDEGVCAPLEAMAREALRAATQTQALTDTDVAPPATTNRAAPALPPNLEQERPAPETSQTREAPRPAPPPKETAAPPSIDPRLEALSEFDRLPLSEKLDLFS